MHKALARAEIWHAGIQLCWRDDPEVIVMAGVCVFRGTLGRLHPQSGAGEGREGQAGSGRDSSFCERSWFRGNDLNVQRISVPRNGAAALAGLI